jgi:fimbrial chaperone protein
MADRLPPGATPLRRRLPGRLALAALLGLAPPAAAATLSVWPLEIALPADGRPTELQVHNPAAAPVMVQLGAVAWAGGPPDPNASAATDIIAVPPAFELAPAGRQLVRLALRKPVTDGPERAFRLLITEVPRAVGGAGQALAVALRINLPVFATPPDAAPEPRWSLRPAGAGAELVLTNAGRARLQVKSLAVQAGAEPVFASDAGGYVLAGEERRWPLKRPLAAWEEPLTLRAETDRGRLEAALLPPR